MNKKILIAPNSFKECADSVTAANYFAQELEKVGSFDNTLLPLSDGGDGFLEVCRKYFNLEILEYRISTPYDETTFNCKVGYDKFSETIYVESADVLGMKIIPPENWHPLLLSSKGMGELFQFIARDVENKTLNVKKVIIGIGGTGTNDMGLGVLEPFGLKLKDKNGSILKVVPINYESVKKIAWSNLTLPFEIEMISDVDNPLLGQEGATFVFGKQKGLTDNEKTIAENGFTNIINLLNNNGIRKGVNDLSGAGGGLPAGLKIFLNARIISSKGFISRILDSVNIEDIDLVITGEGAFDRQSLNQKTTGYLIDIFKELDKPIIICCGIYNENISSVLPRNVFVTELRKYFRSDGDSIKYFRKGIHLAVKDIAERFLA